MRPLEILSHRLLTGYRMETYINGLKYKPKNLLVVEVDHIKTRLIFTPKVLGPDAFLQWLKTCSNPISGLTSGLRLILGASDTLQSLDIDQTVIPHCEGVDNLEFLPFAKETFKMIIDTFSLPPTTPWAFGSKEPHFQLHWGYNNDDDDSETPSLLGFTMRRTNRGVLGIDIALSMSYDPGTGLTYGLLLGCSDAQQSFIRQEIDSLKRMARHPLLLPVLLLGQQQILLRELTEWVWLDLLDVEKASGRTGVVQDLPDGADRKDTTRPRIGYGAMTNKALGVVQLASAWESQTKALISDIETIQKETKHIDSMIFGCLSKEANDTAAASTTNNNNTTSAPRRTGRGYPQIARNLKESLVLVLYNSNTILSDLGFINKRAEAQMNAVYNHVAMEIAAAAKQDSSDMKAIAVLTMAFLPATFMATLFALPFFDFDAESDSQIVKSRFWYFWAVSGPLTVTVLITYGSYVLWHQRKYREEAGAGTRAQDRRPVTKVIERKTNEGASTISASIASPYTQPRFIPPTRQQAGKSISDLEQGISEHVTKIQTVVTPKL